MSVMSGCRSIFVGRVRQIWCLDPTVLPGTAKNIVKKEFFKLPCPFFFDIFVLPYSRANHCAQLSAPEQGAVEEAVPSRFGCFAIRVDIDNARNRHDEMQKLRRSCFLPAKTGIVNRKVKTLFDGCPPLVQTGFIQLNRYIRVVGKQSQYLVFLPMFQIITVGPL